MRHRGTETEEQVQKRLRNAKAELEQGNSPGLFDHILVNDNLEACYERLKVILLFGTLFWLWYWLNVGLTIDFVIENLVS